MASLTSMVITSEPNVRLELQCMGAKLKQTTYYGTVEMMEEDSDPSASLIDGRLPTRFYVECRDGAGHKFRFAVDPPLGVEQNVAAIATFCNPTKVLTGTIMVAGRKLYKRVMKNDFPMNHRHEKLTVTKSSEAGNDSLFSYDGGEGSSPTLSVDDLRRIDTFVSDQPSLESLLWILSELASKYGVE